MDYALRMQLFLKGLYCCSCKTRNLFGKLSCLAFDDHRRNFYLAWCSDCKHLGTNILGMPTKRKRKAMEIVYDEQG